MLLSKGTKEGNCFKQFSMCTMWSLATMQYVIVGFYLFTA